MGVNKSGKSVRPTLPNRLFEASVEKSRHGFNMVELFVEGGAGLPVSDTVNPRWGLILPSPWIPPWTTFSEGNCR